MLTIISELSPYIISVLTAIAAYLKVCSDRKKTSSIRDTANELVNYRVTKLEDRVNSLDGKLDKIINLLSDIRVELAKKADK